MRRSWILGLAGILLVVAAAPQFATGFQPGGRPGPGMRGPGMGNNGQGPGNGQGQGGRDRRDREDEQRDQAEVARIVTNDPKLLSLHKEFMAKAEKMALEYERAKQYDKVRVLCRQMLNLVPNHPPAVELMGKMQEIEATAETAVFEVAADKGWQDTGVTLIEGKQISIRASGSWTLKMEHELTAEGMEIPKEWRDFKLGSLIGIVYSGDIKDAKPFYIGPDYNQAAEKSGKLYVKMHDSENRDNSGRMKLEFKGTFQKGNRS